MHETYVQNSRKKKYLTSDSYLNGVGGQVEHKSQRDIKSGGAGLANQLLGSTACRGTRSAIEIDLGGSIKLG